ncbi:M15 family metallopeptidase [Bizionia gelidisalsuginis]|uniref:D-alanyl-D-alanine dipeptidase n=2 Tax=Bizionia TaxID=283785 RepID=A0A8H2QE52_9FLAO|nr:MULTISPECIES: M15 family metallopeptidase [Bizionia]TYB70483.1 M15 family metallopeptidase [Bizionia saleffrena]TYC10628.1 M15 family metallopeptidase [Bizionia gelidisalsuginis]
MKISVTFFLVLFITTSFAQLPDGFVYVKNSIPDIKVELRYCYDNNFVGENVDGYIENVAILTKEAAMALQKVQVELRKQDLSLKIYDSYRPQRAVNHFVRWAKAVNDTIMKSQFYPNVNKRHLFSAGYIASKSRHSSGSTLDITIVDNKTGEELDMGSPFDFFGKESWVANTELAKKQLENRGLLQKLMLANGFRNYPKEWWHFTLRNEPYRNQYFDFPVE